MAAPYIPPKNSDFVLWADNFRDYVDINFAALFLGAGDVAAIDTAVNDWDAAFALISTPATKTKPTVAAAATQRATTEAVCRLYASQMNLNPAINNTQKASLGITIRKTTKTPIPPPVTYPVLDLVQALPGIHQLSYKDQLIVNGKAKAFGAKLVEIRCTVGTVAPVNPDVVPTKGFTAKSPFQLIYDIVDASKTAFYFARYITFRGEPGPWAPLVPFGII